MNTVCFTGRLTYPNGETYPREHVREYLERLGVTVLDRVRSDCDILVVARFGHTSHETREAAARNIDVLPWPWFAENFQIGGFAHPPHPRWWETHNGVLLCEITDLFEPGEVYRFEPIDRDNTPIFATPAGDPFRLPESDYSPLAGRLVAVHRLVPDFA